MSIKHQIFISSTYEDLKEERAQVIKAILEMGHIPVGMEMFSAADEEQWKLITRQIDETDYYVLLAGHRYGSIAENISYTEKEFDYAASKGIPIYSFLIDKSVEPLAKNTETDASKIVALEKFRQKARQRPVGFWRSGGELHGMVSIALMKAFNTTPRPGWVRTTSIAGPEVTQELSRLSRENAELRGKIEALVDQEIIDQKALIESHISTLKSVKQSIPIRKKNEDDWTIRVDTNLFSIFLRLSSEMIVETSIEHASEFLAIMYNPDKTVALSESAPIPFNFIRSIFADLASMDLVEPSKKKHALSDKDHYWTLSSTGLEMLKAERLRRLELAAAPKASAAAT